jgi:dCTP deaminase
MSVKQGALPIQIIRELVKAGAVKGAIEQNIKPSSLDVSLTDEIYEVSGIFLPNKRETVEKVLEKVSKKRHSINEPLKVGSHYVAKLQEKLNLPELVYAFCNPKSTSGRIDVHVRLMADGVCRYDSIPHGYKGSLWVAITPKTFPIKVAPGLSLNQLRFFTHDTRLSNLEVEIALMGDKLLWSPKGKPYDRSDLKIWDNDGSLILTLDLDSDPIGYEGRPGEGVLDITRVGEYASSKFFKPIKKQGDSLVLKQGSFYILSTHEFVRVPPNLACEMVPMDERSGEFRSHYAGFIDPGWGWGTKGEGKGRPLTLEVRPFEDLVIRKGQPIGKIRFERLTDEAEEIYDNISSNYLQQSGPKLAKYFK